MKQFFLGAAVICLGLISCKKSEVNVEKVENSDGTVTTTITEREQTTTADSVKINETVDGAKQKLDVAGNKIDAAAKDAGQTLKQAGEDVKDAAAKGAEKVEKGAEKMKEDLRKK